MSAESVARPPLRRKVLLAVFAASFVVYNANLRSIGAYDTLPARYLPFSILRTGTLYFDGYYPGGFDPSGRPQYYWLRRSASGHLVSAYPIVVPILVTPFYPPAALYAKAKGLRGDAFRRLAEVMEKLSASAIAALSVVLMLQICHRFAPHWAVAPLTVAYGFATETWVIGSQALWQHGMSELLLAALVLSLVREGRWSAVASGLLAALLVANRPPNVAFAVGALAFVLAHRRSEIGPFLIAPILVAVLLVSYNLHEFHSVFGGYGRLARKLGARGFHPLESALGLLVSPGKGLLVFAPFFAFLAGSLAPSRREELRRVLLVFGPLAVVQFLIVCFWLDWGGGLSYGPRYLTDMTPVLVLALVPALERLHSAPWRTVFAGLVVYGVAVQAIGAFCFPRGRALVDESEMWGPVRYFVELRAGPAFPSFLDTSRRVP